MTINKKAVEYLWKHEMGSFIKGAVKCAIAIAVLYCAFVLGSEFGRLSQIIDDRPQEVSTAKAVKSLDERIESALLRYADNGDTDAFLEGILEASQLSQAIVRVYFDREVAENEAALQSDDAGDSN